MICIDITDPREFDIPKIGMLECYDAESNKTFFIDTANKKMLNDYYKKMAEFSKNKKDIFRKAGVDSIDIVNGLSYLPELIKFFNNRHKRRANG